MIVSCRVAALTRSDVIAAQKASAHRTRFARDIPQMFAILCEHAIDLGWIDRNPAKGVRALKTPGDRMREHLPWTDKAWNNSVPKHQTFRAWFFESEGGLYSVWGIGRASPGATMTRPGMVR